MAKSTIVPLTQEQFQTITPILKKLKYGEALIAQVFPDGLRLKHLTHTQTLAVATALGSDGSISKTAAEANFKRKFTP